MSLNPIKDKIEKDASNIAKGIIESGKNQKSYGTGLFFEHYIVGALDSLGVPELEKLRFLITKKIREKEKKKAIIEKQKATK